MTRKTDDLDRHIGLRLKMRRILQGLSQEDLSKILGVTFQQIQKYEKSLNRISASRLYEISNALGVSIEYFYECYVSASLESETFFLSDSAKSSVENYENTLPNAENLRKKRKVNDAYHDMLVRLLKISDEKEQKKIIEILEKMLDNL